MGYSSENVTNKAVNLKRLKNKVLEKEVNKLKVK